MNNAHPGPVQALEEFRNLARPQGSTSNYFDSAKPERHPLLKRQPGYEYIDELRACHYHYAREMKPSPTLIEALVDSAEKSSFRLIKLLPATNLNKKSPSVTLCLLHATLYERMNLPGPPGVKGIYIACGENITVTILPQRTKLITLTRDVLNLFEGSDTPLFSFYANAPEGIYVPDSSCVEVKPNTTEAVNVDQENKDVTLGIPPLKEVIVVVEGIVKTVVVSMWTFRAIRRDFYPEGDVGTLAARSRVPKERLVRKASELDKDLEVVLDDIMERMENLEKKADRVELERRFRQLMQGL